MAQTTKGKALERLRKALDEIAELKQLSTDSPQFKKWRRDTRVAITNTFDSDSGHVSEFAAVRFFSLSINRQQAYTQGLESAAAILESMIDEINEYWEDGSGASRSSDNPRNERITTKEVFIVHGRNEGAREKVARFLERLELKPVVLHEQPNEGRTIIAIGRTVLTSALTLSKLETRQQDGEALPGSAMVSLKRPYLQPTSA